MADYFDSLLAHAHTADHAETPTLRPSWSDFDLFFATPRADHDIESAPGDGPVAAPTVAPSGHAARTGPRTTPAPRLAGHSPAPDSALDRTDRGTDAPATTVGRGNLSVPPREGRMPQPDVARRAPVTPGPGRPAGDPTASSPSPAHPPSPAGPSPRRRTHAHTPESPAPASHPTVAPAGPVIRVSVGRIEVRASVPPARTVTSPAAGIAPPPPRLSLDEFLSRNRPGRSGR